MMREVLVDLWLKGAVDGVRPWSAEEKVTFICPVPGYDRHFTLLDWFGIDTVTVAMNEDGPDMDAVEALVADDRSEEHTSELQSLMRISYAVFCLKKKITDYNK